uniref:Putative ovule protein n=1 Tax=Solanum chacoense TaxID=4108 RepID=A0A0V0HMF6_SOLCH
MEVERLFQKTLDSSASNPSIVMLLPIIFVLPLLLFLDCVELLFLEPKVSKTTSSSLRVMVTMSYNV